MNWPNHSVVHTLTLAPRAFVSLSEITRLMRVSVYHLTLDCLRTRAVSFEQQQNSYLLKISRHILSGSRHPNEYYSSSRPLFAEDGFRREFYMSLTEFRNPSGNRLLACLKRQEYEHLLPHLEPVHLAKGRTIYEIDDSIQHAYFPEGGMLSLLSITESGGTIEVGMIGNEGMVGIPSILGVNRTPYQVIVQIAGDALRIRSGALREAFNRGGQFQDLLLRYTHSLLSQISQSVVCNHFHTVEERLCRWLLVTANRVESDTFHLTQEFLSYMLGVPRTSITMIAGTLQAKKLIRYSRGKIQLLDQRGLEEIACECYRIIIEGFEQALVA